MAGRHSETVVPCPGVLCTSMSPPDWRTKPYTMDMPRPVPLPACLVVKKGSKMRETVAASMPAPSSTTSRQT